MADLLESGATWLAGQFKAHVSRDVTYQRGVQQIVVKATVGRTEFEQADESGIVTTHQSRDYLIHAADLVLGGGPTLPEPGDRIVEVVGSTTYTHEVMAIPSGEHYRFSDPYRVLLRIHTKLVAVT